MQTKTKIIISVIILIILLGLAGGFYYKNKQNKTQSKNQPDISQNIKTDDATKTQVDQVAFIASEGEIVSLNDNQLEIKNSKGVAKVSLDEKVSVYTVNGSEHVEKSLADIKQGAQVEIIISTRSGLVTMVGIL
jgi:uncharacterized protein HemX